MRLNRLPCIFTMLLLGVVFLANDVAAGVMLQSFAGARAIREFTGPGQQVFSSEDRENRLGHPASATELRVPGASNYAQARATSISNKTQSWAVLDPLVYESFFPGTFAQSDAFASTTLTETITLVGDPLQVAIALLNRGPLYARAHLSGAISYDTVRNFVGTPGVDEDQYGISARWAYDAKLRTGIETAQARDEAVVFQFGLSRAESLNFNSLFAVNRGLSAELDFQFDGTNFTTSYTRELATFAAVVVGRTHVNFGNSFGLTGVTFADGTTPEELGFSLEFGGGRTSPNLTAVPEPSSVAIFGFLGLAAGLHRTVRQRNA